MMLVYLVLKGTALMSFDILYQSLAAERKLSASEGDSHAALAMQLNFDSSPPVYNKKHMPPVRSV